MNTIQEIKDFCKKIKVNPAKIFIDSQGCILVRFHSKKHSDRYEKAIHKYLDNLGYKPGKGPEGWDDRLIAEMNATRH